MTRETPCDWGDCPYNAMYSEDCRYYCGLGVDEDSYPDEDEEESIRPQKNLQMLIAFTEIKLQEKKLSGMNI